MQVPNLTKEVTKPDEEADKEDPPDEEAAKEDPRVTLMSSDCLLPVADH